MTKTSNVKLFLTLSLSLGVDGPEVSSLYQASDVTMRHIPLLGSMLSPFETSRDISLEKRAGMIWLFSRLSLAFINLSFNVPRLS